MFGSLFPLVAGAAVVYAFARRSDIVDLFDRADASPDDATTTTNSAPAASGYSAGSSGDEMAMTQAPETLDEFSEQPVQVTGDYPQGPAPVPAGYYDSRPSDDFAYALTDGASGMPVASGADPYWSGGQPVDRADISPEIREALDRSSPIGIEVPSGAQPVHPKVIVRVPPKPPTMSPDHRTVTKTLTTIKKKLPTPAKKKTAAKAKSSAKAAVRKKTATATKKKAKRKGNK